MSDVSEATQFKKGQPRPPNAGRRRGTPNKFTSVKHMLLEAIEELGGKEWIKEVARRKPEVVLQLAGRLIPLEHKMGATDEAAPVINIHFSKVSKGTREAPEAGAPVEEATWPRGK